MRLGADVLGLDLYLVLGVGRNATSREIRRAYLRSVRASHPDLNPGDASASERMARINVAARVLLDPALRASYDRTRSSARSAARPRETAWYDRVVVGSDEEWVRPAPPVRRAYGPALRALGKELRSVWSRLSLAIEDELTAMRVRTRIMTAALLVLTASSLIAWAKPRNLLAGPGEPPQPTSVNPIVLDP